MAKLNFNISNKVNLLPINNQYTFNIKFYITGTENLSGNTNLIQNQNVVVNNVTTPFVIPFNVLDGNYTLNGITAKIFYNNALIGVKDLQGVVVSCLPTCNIVVNSVNTITLTQYEVYHTSTTTPIKWELRLAGSLISQGTTNPIINSASFIITTPSLTIQPHTLKLIGVNCLGEGSKVFTPSPGGFNPETQGTYEATAIIT